MKISAEREGSALQGVGGKHQIVSREGSSELPRGCAGRGVLSIAREPAGGEQRAPE